MKFMFIDIFFSYPLAPLLQADVLKLIFITVVRNGMEGG